MTATMAEINEEVAVNPDAQAAVTDFLDYTEYLPTDLIRSLSLIQQLDETYLTNADSVHHLTHTYGSLPSITPSDRPDASKLRSTISKHLDLAISARESAYAEAVRLADLTDRHQERLKSIVAKLHALPKPPSRDPTPVPQPPGSIKRSRIGRKLEGPPRLTLKAPKGPIASTILHRPRHRRITVPGEVLPPYDPDEPIASTEVSDWESEPPSPIRPVTEKSHKHRSAIDHERKPREHRETSTYRKPTPPPDDAVVGGTFKPWTRLSEWEMYKLRKKMKKNHTWEPSDVMIRRELAEKGRGWDNYYKARAAAHANGTTFIDIDNVDKSQTTITLKMDTKPALKSEVPTRPKSSKRSESRKEKLPTIPPDPAARAAAEQELAARRLGDIGSAFKNLFTPFSSALASLKTATTTPPATTPSKEHKPKKRKLEEPASVTPSAEPEGHPKKKLKLLPKPSPLAATEPTPAAPPSAGTIKIPPITLKVPSQPSAVSATSTPVSTSRPVSMQRTASATAKPEATPPPTRPPSRRSAAASVEPATVTSTRPSRRTSTTPAAQTTKTPVIAPSPKLYATAASRRPKREAPGTVTQSSRDGGAAVSVSKRKNKPGTGNKAQVAKGAQGDEPEIFTDIDGNQEIIDEDEDRYCICHEVSYGEMIQCEMDSKVNTPNLWLLLRSRC